MRVAGRKDRWASMRTKLYRTWNIELRSVTNRESPKFDLFYKATFINTIISVFSKRRNSCDNENSKM